MGVLYVVIVRRPSGEEEQRVAYSEADEQYARQEFERRFGGEVVDAIPIASGLVRSDIEEFLQGQYSISARDPRIRAGASHEQRAGTYIPRAEETLLAASLMEWYMQSPRARPPRLPPLRGNLPSAPPEPAEAAAPPAEAEAPPEPARPPLPEQEEYTVVDIARSAGVRPNTVRDIAHANGIGTIRRGRLYFTREEAERLLQIIRERYPQAAEEGEEEGEAAGVARAPQRPGGGLLGGTAAGMLALHAVAGTGQRLAQETLLVGLTAASQAAALVGNIVAQGLSAAGASGQAVAQIGQSVANLLVAGLQTVGSLALRIGGAIIDVVVSGLQLVTGIAAFAVGGAILGIIMAGLGTIATALGSAISQAFGEIGRAAQSILQGVVSIARDVVQEARQMAASSAAMRYIGGVVPGGDIAALLGGEMLGIEANTLLGMFGTWGGRPEFQMARYAALGATYDPRDPLRSFLAAAQQLRELPELSRFPMAQAAFGAGAADALRLANYPPALLAQALNIPERFGIEPQLFYRLETALFVPLNEIRVLFRALKLEVLQETLPIVVEVLQWLRQQWAQREASIVAWIRQLPTAIRNGVSELTSWWQTSGLPLWQRLVSVAERIWEFLSLQVWPFVRGLLQGLGLDVSGLGGGMGGLTPQQREQIREAAFAAGERAGERVRGIGGRVLRAARWAGEHPWGAAAIGLGAMALPGLISRGAAGLLSWLPRGAAAAGPFLGGIGRAALGLGRMAVASPWGLLAAVVGGGAVYGIGSEVMRRREEGEGGWRLAGGILRDILIPQPWRAETISEIVMRSIPLIGTPLVWAAQALGRRVVPFAGRRFTEEELARPELERIRAEAARRRAEEARARVTLYGRAYWARGEIRPTEQTVPYIIQLIRAINDNTRALREPGREDRLTIQLSRYFAAQLEELTAQQIRRRVELAVAG